jgi:hypothetical protein
MAAFATAGDLADRWRPLSPEETVQAEALLEDASTILRMEIPTVDSRVELGTLPANVPLMVVVGMVKRAMVAPAAGEGVQTAQTNVGPFGQSFTYANPMGHLYLTKQDRRLLGVGGQRAFTIDTMPPLPVVIVSEYP